MQEIDKEKLASNEINQEILKRLESWLLERYTFDRSGKINISLVALDAGITRQSLSYVLNGRQRLTTDMLHQLSTLGIDIHWLITGQPFTE